MVKQKPHLKGVTNMRPHEKLQTWIESVDIVLNIYKATERFPKEEKFGLTSQIRRATVSIPANIAEGAARNSSKEFAYFVSNAQGSASELETELIIAYRLGYLSETLFSKLLADLERIGRMITGLTRRLRRVPA
jgi:four helix bundle protein